MVLFGGFDLPASGPPGWNPANDAWEYDPATDGWRKLAPMPTTRGGGEVQDDKFLAAYRAFEAYDPASDTWWQLPSMLLPRHECIMAALGNRIHVAGGSVQSAIVPLPKGLSFDTDSHEAFEVLP